MNVESSAKPRKNREETKQKFEKLQCKQMNSMRVGNWNFGLGRVTCGRVRVRAIAMDGNHLLRPSQLIATQAFK